MSTSTFITELTNGNFSETIAKTQKSIFRTLEKYKMDLTKLNENDIDNLMEYLNENSRRLNYLLNKNKNMSEEIQAKLDLFAYYKKSFSKSQIKLYNEYLSVKSAEENSIKLNLALIYDKETSKLLTNSILENDINYNKIGGQITSILAKQNQVIKGLGKMISKANKFQMLEFVYYAEIDSFESIELPNDGWDKFKIVEIKDIDNIDIRPKTINNLIKCDEYSSISHNVNYDWA